jgi:glycosyltransferase involved in cell wall biosynthesis
MAARVAGVPSIISTRHSLVARPRNMTVEMKYACAAVFCDWVVGICDATAENLREIHTVARKKIIRVYNGAAPVERAPESEWPKKSGFTLIFVGRLEPVKNHPFLLKAFAKAIASRPDLRLWMVGDGSERSNLEQLARDLGLSESVKFWGQQLDVAPFFSAADAFIMSSRSEGLPMSLLQAFSLGLPAIVTDVGGMAEVVRLAQAGLTAALDETASMSEAILSIARNGLERARYSKNAAEAFNTLFSVQTMVDAYMALYRKSPRAHMGAQFQT